MLKCKSGELERTGPKQQNKASVKKYCYKKRWPFILCSITGQRMQRKPEPETTTLPSALERLHGGQQQSQTLEGNRKKTRTGEDM